MATCDREATVTAASNTQDCFREVVGKTVIGVLFNAMPPCRHDLAQGTKTLIFDDTTGLTIANNGSFWLESATDVQQAIRKREAELKRVNKEISEVLRLAGQAS